MNAADRQHSTQLAAIEALRGVAALLVLCYHYAELMKAPVPDALGFVIRNHFGLGVPLFYTLSGFVLAYGYADKLWQGGNTDRQILAFYLRRLFRIAPLFYAMLAVWLVADFLIWHQIFPAQTLLLNLCFLFGLVPGQHESIVRAGWSIGIEMLFYLFFPIITLLSRGLYSTVAGFVLACVVSAAVFNALNAAKLESYAYMNLGTHMPFFMAGLLCQRIWQTTGFWRNTIGGWALFALALMFAHLVTGGHAIPLFAKLPLLAPERMAWALIFGLLILSACLVSNPLLERGPLRHFGKLSYSLYLVHPLVMAGLIKLGFVNWLTALDVSPALAFVVGIAGTVGAVSATASLSFRFIEVPGIAVGRRVAGRLLAPPVQGVA